MFDSRAQPMICIYVWVTDHVGRMGDGWSLGPARVFTWTAEGKGGDGPDYPGILNTWRYLVILGNTWQYLELGQYWLPWNRGNTHDWHFSSGFSFFIRLRWLSLKMLLSSTQFPQYVRNCLLKIKQLIINSCLWRYSNWHEIDCKHVISQFYIAAMWILWISPVRQGFSDICAWSKSDVRRYFH